MTSPTLLGCSLALALLSAAAAAQQAPVTGRMLGDPVVPSRTEAQAPAPPAADAARASTPGPVPPPAYRAASVATLSGEPGQATRDLIRLQASGTQAGPGLPVLGDQARASYARYLKSFEHELPEYFENTVGTSTKAGSN
ncbi:DUF3613 domain-containing protein [Stenotrophomonas sp. 169]|uniref:DUF3613 domain-containing protein n=1 Tax=Stenotrophomonas sp. 169 TaxID=2770322 RepID=UPI0016628462|nr:DUF3613 domain-containing protein [Stenotrophomonas sp. 169]QNR98907.1 DUF3613 domain-containing protein [Stenotrophomonas sp. 169]